jgi:hypothetical protein
VSKQFGGKVEQISPHTGSDHHMGHEEKQGQDSQRIIGCRIKRDECDFSDGGYIGNQIGESDESEERHANADGYSQRQ